MSARDVARYWLIGVAGIMRALWHVVRHPVGFAEGVAVGRALAESGASSAEILERVRRGSAP